MTSSDVKASPLLNVTPSCSLKVHVLPSGESQLVASVGWTLKSWARPTRFSWTWQQEDVPDGAGHHDRVVLAVARLHADLEGAALGRRAGRARALACVALVAPATHDGEGEREDDGEDEHRPHRLAPRRLLCVDFSLIALLPLVIRWSCGRVTRPPAPRSSLVDHERRMLTATCLSSVYQAQ